MLVTDVSTGVLVLNADGDFVYTPNANFAGNDLFVYSVSDGTQTAQASVLLKVLSEPDAPVAADDGYWIEDPSVAFEVPVDSGLLANDANPEGGSMTATLVDAPDGQLELSEDRSFVYTGGDEFSGSDSFSYTASGSGGDSLTTTVRLLGPNLIDTGEPIDPVNPNDLPVGFVDDQGLLCATAPGGGAGGLMWVLLGLVVRRRSA